MKKIITLFTAFIIGQITFGQVKEGRILFEQKIDMHRNLPAGNVQAHTMIPPFRVSNFELFFGDNQSLYRKVEEEVDITESNNNGIVMRIGMPSAIVFKNFSTASIVEQRELAEKEYIIEDSLKNLNWKLEDGTSTILGYACKKATSKTERGSTVEAYYTEEIPVSSGPESFSGLPGMILKVDVNNQHFVYTAKGIEKTLNKKELKAPVKGKKVTKKDFVKLQQEIFSSQGGNIRIVTN